MKINRKNENADKQIKFHFDNVYFYDPQQYESIYLYQIGDLSSQAGYTIGEHLQLCYEISYVVSGKGIFYTNGKAYPVQEGDIFLSLPGELHNGKADAAEPFRFFYVGFNFHSETDGQHAMTHVRKMFDQTKKPLVQDNLSIDVPFINIFNELINLKNYSTLMINTYLQQIIVLGYRSFYESWETQYEPQPKVDETKQIVYEVINYIDVNLHRITELPQIAAELYYSYSYLSHIFSKEVGLTIKDYYNRKRFEKAIEWLKNGDLNVTQIAEKLQYQSIHTFSKAFRNSFGISPTEYQALYINRKK
ncbi:AraC family transcriptional regulator [Paenibacillus eucommiae]|uniref:AraC-like DNA-binding protein/mannose-6-phosphate isomerase-like protein (Cupin superfamily) n=1 Tax=Paenibacillus eucommiae TaxID=1355755 RepID=A0ABS4J578_9BACL|nr:AraC family transcriptional regulator [Paenibacillus eucommiae]MBP1993944.1 AraC-like DNA-binding protein/mannose-6-phosphate isomerase-like protein (cupin superfamily) [Paenibacillus eucommiae]